MMRRTAAWLLVLTLTLSTFSSALQQDDPKKAGATTKGDSDKQTVAEPSKKEPEKPTPAPKKNEARKDTKQETKKESGKPGDKKAASGDEAKKEDEDKPKDPFSTATFNGLKLRSVGPSFVSGRVGAFAVNPKNRSQYYAAVSSGGVWKTDNAGTTWTPVFDNEGSYSIGTVAMDPNDSNVIWVGTGENNSQRSVGYGDGVYRSEDGGKSWKNMGLKKSEHIARILIDPRDSKVIYVAAQGPLWGPGGDRGLYKSTDGGKTWTASLSISENTGVTDVVMDPRNPDVLYAASYQRRRHVWTMINGGPESGIHKSTDAGATWTKLKSGLPSEDMGRIGLAISPTNPDLLYATVEASNKKGGVFRSTNRGATWEKRNDFDTTAMYYSTIYVDPKNEERIYIMNTFIMVSDDGGKTVRRLGERSKHVDSHAMWIDPNDTNYYLVGCDGGIYESYDRAATWQHKGNLSVVQFYDVTVDNSKPFYYIYGGTQDNNSIGGPSRTNSASGIVNSDWFITTGGDGFRQQVDPDDPNIVYSESQYGGLVRYDRRTGEEIGIQPQEGKGEAPLRWNWDSPLIISPHKGTRLYFAANRLFRSEDRGDTWTPISGDLSRQIDRDTLPVMGKVWGPDAVAKNASTSFYGNIVALAESPKKAGVLYVGTDDGLIHVSENDGGAWRKIETVAGVPARTYVSRLLASQHDERTVYASFDNHKNADFKPYIFKSADAGATWTSITANLPENGSVLAVAEDHVNPNLLFAGTEFGLFFTIDGGKKWIQLKGGLPTIAVRDAVIQKRENDLVIATFGRGFYLLDDYTPLRNLKPEMLGQESFTLPVKDTMMYIERMPLGGRNKAAMGEQFFTAENPPYGATITYYLKEKYKTLREKRQEAEKKAAKANKGDAYATMKYPTLDQIREEAEADEPLIWLTIMDSAGAVVRRVPARNNAGINRVAWNLRYPATELFEPPAGGPSDFPWEFGPQGRLAMPGQYSVKLSKKVEGKWEDLSTAQSFNVYVDGADKMKMDDRAVLYEFQQKVAKLDRAVGGAVSSANEMKTRFKALRRALTETSADTTALIQRLDDADKRLSKLQIILRGDNVLRSRQENVPNSINDRVNGILGDQRMSTAKPTQTHRDSYARSAEEFTSALATLKGIAGELAQLEKDAEAAGAPWTQGRIPEWKPE